MSEDLWAARYAQAFAATPVKAMAASIGVGAEGYWLDDGRYFFLAERTAANGQVVEIPCVAVAGSDALDALEVAALKAMLSEALGEAVEDADLGAALYDMSAEGVLWATVKGRQARFDFATRILLGVEPALDRPHVFSPDGRRAVFVEAYDLWLRDLETGEVRPLTTGGRARRAFGRHPENGLATLSYRRRPVPVALWSDDGAWVLTHEVDESAVGEFPIVEHVPAEGRRPRLHTMAYVMPGEAPASFALVAIHIASGRTVKSSAMPFNLATPLMTRHVWWAGPGRVCFLLSDLHLKWASLRAFDLEDGSEQELLREETERGYLELNPTIYTQPNVRRIEATGETIWWSERDGWGHLYLYGASGDVSPITRGAWQVREIVHVDPARRRILFTAGGLDPKADPAVRSLCSIGFDGEGFMVLAQGGDVVVAPEPNGMNGQDRRGRPSLCRGGASANGAFVTLRRTSILHGNEVVILDIATRSERILCSARPTQDERASLRPFEALAADGETRLHGVLFLPPEFDPGRSYPLVDFIYPGPQKGVLPRAHSGRASHLCRSIAALGIVTFMVDTRGVPYQSRAVHQSGYGRLNEPQLADHAAVVTQLCDRHAFLDRSRVGIFGASGGGFATARALFDYPEVFHAGVSVCGNHDSRAYRAAWLDMYAGPGEPLLSEIHSNLARVDGLKGRLMLVSGDMDENVPLTQTLLLADALIKAGKDFELVIIPNEGHMLLLTSAYLQKKIWDFFLRTLLEAEPPKAFPVRFAPHELARAGRLSARDE